MELNREQIIKALEDCKGEGVGLCGACPFYWADDCTKQLHNCVSALIRELTEENERLEDNLIKQSTENIMLLLDKQDIKADTVRKMQERLKENAFVFASTNDGKKYFAVETDTIDQITKELLEETK